MDADRIPLVRPARRAARGARAIGPILSPTEIARSIGRVAQATAAPLLPRRSLESAVSGRVVVVTGASYGIGHAAALQIAGAGARTVVVARGAEQLDDLVGRIRDAGGTAHAYPADLSDMEAIDALAAALAADGLEADVLVNNAARSIRRSIAQSYDRFHDYERTMRLNSFGAVRLTLALLPGMRARRRGHVVNVSTLGVQTISPRFSAYLASKAALEAFTRVAAAECLDDDVRFTTVHMPLVRTPMSRATKLYDSMPALSEEAAGELLCGALCSRAEQVGPLVGALAEVGHAISPAAANELLAALYRAVPEPTAQRSRAEP